MGSTLSVYFCGLTTIRFVDFANKIFSVHLDANFGLLCLLKLGLLYSNIGRSLLNDGVHSHCLRHTNLLDGAFLDALADG